MGQSERGDGAEFLRYDKLSQKSDGHFKNMLVSAFDGIQPNPEPNYHLLCVLLGLINSPPSSGLVAH